MDYITISKVKIHLDPINEQISPLGRHFKLSGIKIDYSKTKKWLKEFGIYRHATWYIFKYTDNDEFFGFYFDEYDKFQYKLTHNELLKL